MVVPRYVSVCIYDNGDSRFFTGGGGSQTAGGTQHAACPVVASQYQGGSYFVDVRNCRRPLVVLHIPNSFAICSYLTTQEAVRSPPCRRIMAPAQVRGGNAFLVADINRNPAADLGV